MTRLLQLLTLDRFCDFVTGSNAVAPVREAAAQALSSLLVKLQEFHENHIESNNDNTGDLFSIILVKICKLLQIQKDQVLILINSIKFLISRYFSIGIVARQPC